MIASSIQAELPSRKGIVDAFDQLVSTVTVALNINAYGEMIKAHEFTVTSMVI